MPMLEQTPPPPPPLSSTEHTTTPLNDEQPLDKWRVSPKSSPAQSVIKAQDSSPVSGLTFTRNKSNEFCKLNVPCMQAIMPILQMIFLLGHSSTGSERSETKRMDEKDIPLHFSPTSRPQPQAKVTWWECCIGRVTQPCPPCSSCFFYCVLFLI